MNKTKILLTAFAVFASFLMLMTTSMAAPVQEKVTLDSIEQQQNELTDSLESFVTNFENDREIARLSAELENDRELSYIAGMIERTDDMDQKISLLTNYVNVLSEKPAYNSLKKYTTSTYSEDISSISAQSDKLAKLLEQYNQENSETDEYMLGGALMLTGAIYTVTESYGVTEISDSCTNMGTIDSINGMEYHGWYIPNDDGDSLYDQIDEPLEAQWGGFLRNMNGDLLVPGEGWISPDDPNYDDWLQIEDALQDLGITPGGIFDILIEIILQILNILGDILLTIIFALGLYIATAVLIILQIIVNIYIGIYAGLNAFLEWLQQHDPIP